MDNHAHGQVVALPVVLLRGGLLYFNGFRVSRAAWRHSLGAPVMSFWQTLKNRWSSPDRAPVSSQRVEVAPGLVVSVIPHVIESPPRGKVACWSYVTEGLARHGQKELVLTLSQGAGPEASSSQELFKTFVTILELARQVRTVGVGGMTRFGQGAPLGRHLLCVPAFPLPGVPVPGDGLAVILASGQQG